MKEKNQIWNENQSGNVQMSYKINQLLGFIGYNYTIVLTGLIR